MRFFSRITVVMNWEVFKASPNACFKHVDLSCAAKPRQIYGLGLWGTGWMFTEKGIKFKLRDSRLQISMAYWSQAIQLEPYIRCKGTRSPEASYLNKPFQLFKDVELFVGAYRNSEATRVWGIHACFEHIDLQVGVKAKTKAALSRMDQVSWSGMWVQFGSPTLLFELTASIRE